MPFHTQTEKIFSFSLLYYWELIIVFHLTGPVFKIITSKTWIKASPFHSKYTRHRIVVFSSIFMLHYLTENFNSIEKPSLIIGTLKNYELHCYDMILFQIRDVDTCFRELWKIIWILVGYSIFVRAESYELLFNNGNRLEVCDRILVGWVCLQRQTLLSLAFFVIEKWKILFILDEQSRHISIRTRYEKLY